MHETEELFVELKVGETETVVRVPLSLQNVVVPQPSVSQESQTVGDTVDDRSEVTSPPLTRIRRELEGVHLTELVEDPPLVLRKLLKDSKMKSKKKTAKQGCHPELCHNRACTLHRTEIHRIRATNLKLRQCL